MAKQKTNTAPETAEQIAKRKEAEAQAAQISKTEQEALANATKAAADDAIKAGGVNEEIIRDGTQLVHVVVKQMPNNGKFTFNGYSVSAVKEGGSLKVPKGLALAFPDHLTLIQI